MQSQTRNAYEPKKILQLLKTYMGFTYYLGFLRMKNGLHKSVGLWVGVRCEFEGRVGHIHPYMLSFLQSWEKNPRAIHWMRKEKAYNRALSRIPVKVENIFSQIKTLKIIGDRFRK